MTRAFNLGCGAADSGPVWVAGRPEGKAPLVRDGWSADRNRRGGFVFQNALALAAMSFGFGVALSFLKNSLERPGGVYPYDISVETCQFKINQGIGRRNHPGPARAISRPFFRGR